jgi:hypothetical protein
MIKKSVGKTNLILFSKETGKEQKNNVNVQNPLLPRQVYEFWQRDSLAVPLFTREVASQKLKYIHNNPLAGHWQLTKHPCDCKYSPASHNELNEKLFFF